MSSALRTWNLIDHALNSERHPRLHRMVDWTGGQIKNTDSADDVKHVDLTQVHCMLASGTVHACQAQPLTLHHLPRPQICRARSALRRPSPAICSRLSFSTWGRFLAMNGVRKEEGTKTKGAPHLQPSDQARLGPCPQGSRAPFTRTTVAASSQTTIRRQASQ